MRLVSQDGEIDVPYEHGSLCIGFIKGEEHIINTISYYNYSSQKGTKLAEYSSRNKCLKVMEMLRKEYLDLFQVKYEAFWYSNDYPKVFQFPADEDVEVQDE